MIVAAGAQDMTPISVPYQAQSAFIAYTNCVGEHLKNDARRESGGEHQQEAVLVHEVDEIGHGCKRAGAG